MASNAHSCTSTTVPVMFLEHVGTETLPTRHQEALKGRTTTSLQQEEAMGYTTQELSAGHWPHGALCSPMTVSSGMLDSAPTT